MGVSATAQQPPPDLVYFSNAGQQFVSIGTGRFRFPFPATLIGATAAINTAPTGADLIVDINKNGTTVFPETPSVSYRSFTSATGTSTTAAVNKPAGAVAGDMLVLLVDDKNDNIGAYATLTLPSGFTWRNSTGDWSGTTRQTRISVATKLADGTEGATFTSTFSGNVTSLSWDIWCVALPGGVSYVNSAGASWYSPMGSSTAAPLGSMMMPGASGLVMLVDAPGGTPSLPAGMTSLVNTTQFRLAYELRAADGPTGLRTSAFGGVGDWRALMIGLAKQVRSIPTIAIGTNATAAEVVPAVTAIAAGDYLTVDVDQIGSGTAGSDLSVFVRYRRL